MERLTLDVLHDEKIDAVFAPDVVKGKDVGVVQARDRACFLLEALSKLGLSESSEGSTFNATMRSRRVSLAL